PSCIGSRRPQDRKWTQGHPAQTLIPNIPLFWSASWIPTISLLGHSKRRAMQKLTESKSKDAESADVPMLLQAFSRRIRQKRGSRSFTLFVDGAQLLPFRAERT